MIEKTVTVTELRRRLDDIVEEVNAGDTIYFITRYGKRVAVIIGVDKFKDLAGDLTDVPGKSPQKV